MTTSLGFAPAVRKRRAAPRGDGSAAARGGARGRPVIEAARGEFYNPDTGKYNDAAAVTTLVSGVVIAILAVPAAIAARNATSQSDQMTAARSAVQKINGLITKETEDLFGAIAGKSD